MRLIDTTANHGYTDECNRSLPTCQAQGKRVWYTNEKGVNMTEQIPDDLEKLDVIAEILGVSRSAVRYWISTGAVRGWRKGKWLILASLSEAQRHYQETQRIRPLDSSELARASEGA